MRRGQPKIIKNTVIEEVTAMRIRGGADYEELTETKVILQCQSRKSLSVCWNSISIAMRSKNTQVNKSLGALDVQARLILINTTQSLHFLNKHLGLERQHYRTRKLVIGIWKWIALLHSTPQSPDSRCRANCCEFDPWPNHRTALPPRSSFKCARQVMSRHINFTSKLLLAGFARGFAVMVIATSHRSSCRMA